MHLPRPLFVVLAVAVFVVALGAGGAVGYGRAADAATGTQPAGANRTAAAAGTSAAGTGAPAGPTPAATPDGRSPDATATPVVGPIASGTGPSTSSSLTPTATWPLVAADAPGPPFDVALRVPVLMYHRIAPADQVGRSLPGLVVSPDLFAAQLEAPVAAGWRSITAAQLAADLAAGVQPPPRTFVITFDDGRSDGYTEAFPILRRLGLVATFYVITGRIGMADNLSASQLGDLAAAGMEIGSHTVDHVRLSSANPEAAQLQLTRSAALIASVTGQRPTTFAYPFGGLDPFAQSLVLSTGYAMAFTEVSGCQVSWSTRLAAPRLRVSASTMPTSLVHRLEACTGGG